MNLSKIPSHEMCDLSFSTYSSEDIKKMSVVEVTNPRSFDMLGHPTRNGVYDPRFGPIEMREACVTCGFPSSTCSGHFGHIVLPVPAFNPLFIRIIFKLLKGSCFRCRRLRAPLAVSTTLLYQLRALDHGLVTLARDMDLVGKKCIANNPKRINAKNAALLELTESLNSMLKNRLEESGESSVHLEEISSSSMVKSVLEYRNLIINEYLNRHINTNDCPTCLHGRRPMHLEYKARIIIAPMKTKRKKSKDVSKKSKTKKKKDDDDDEELLHRYEVEEVDEDFLEDTVTETMSEKQIYMTPEDARNHLLKVYEKDGDILRQLFGSLVKNKDSTGCPINGFFLDVLLVPPTRFRPVTRIGGSSDKYDNPHSVAFSSVVLDSIILRHLLVAIKNNLDEVPLEIASLVSRIVGSTMIEKLQSTWFTLQVHINVVFDGDADKLNNREASIGVRQVLEKKSGLFRMHMMGKRVNYAARSVISPDPYINVDEIGVPDIFAKKLTYPQPVTPWNIVVMRQAVINGPDVHPGAVMVQNEDGSTVMLSRNRIQREAVAKQLLTPSLDTALKGCKIVYRHLQNGDALLLNRQPTLHKPSIMAHKAVVLPGEKTLRLNYSNCKAYNADFDGDEMNAHLPQSEMARAEAYTIASVSHQYLVPKDGTPLGGLIQDHIIAAVLLMVRGKYFNRNDYQQLVFGGLTNMSDRVFLLRPSILRPYVMWSGKQIVSTVLINTIPKGEHLLSLNGKSKIPIKSWQNMPCREWKAGGSKPEDKQMSESEIIIRNGEILCGILDKAHCGPTAYGLVHCCYELYGGEVSGLLLSRLARLFTHFLQLEGFTLGVHDILVTPAANKKRTRLMKKASHMGETVVREALNLPSNADKATLNEKMIMAHLGRDQLPMKEIDLSMKRLTDQVNNDINKVCMPDGLLKHFPDNSLQLMVISGAKGATVNCMQISCLLGQIELEGHRPPLMISGRTLPAFLPYDPSPRAGGFVDGRFLTGIRPQEYFFHCMAGREGLIDTAVKTSRSGYLQRCLIKHLEGVIVGYDLSVRDSDGSIIQFQYGEDALDVVKIPFLQKEQLSFLVENAKCVLHKDEIERLKERHRYDKILKCNKKIRKWCRKQKKIDDISSMKVGDWSSRNSRSAAFVNFSKEHLVNLQETYPGDNENSNRGFAKEKLMDMWYKMTVDERKIYRSQEKCPDPVTSIHRPDVVLGAISERMENVIESYLSELPPYAAAVAKMSTDDIRTMMHHKVLRSVCEPGEAVGLLAAQSVGEPSTQMTLNTFHFAGRGEMNVTLGIPRLREILMTASKNIATPSLEVPFLTSGVKRLEKKADLLRQKLTRVHLSEVLDRIDITERIVIRPRDRTRTYIIRFTLLPFKRYRRYLYVTPFKILHFLETVFFSYLINMIKKKGQLLQMSTLVSNVAMRESLGAKSFDKDNVDGDGDGDGDSRDRDGQENQKEANRDDGGVSSDDDEGDEADATAQKSRSRHNQELDLAELDEDEKNLQKQEAAESDDEGFGEPEVAGIKLEHDESVEVILKVEEDEDEINEQNAIIIGDENDNADVLEWKPSMDELQRPILDEERRIKKVMAIHNCISDYKYDTESEEWCQVTIKLDINQKRLDMTTLIKEEVEKAIVHHTQGIKRAFIVDQNDDKGDTKKVLKTDGVNIQEIFKYRDLLDLSRLYSNDVYAISQTYGIEAAFRVIVKEIQNVFAVYGIQVDPRHLLLIADYMTFDGSYQPFSRSGMSSNASPLQQMSFETTMHFLQQATILGLPDPLKSPSSKLVVGQIVGCGTGSFGLIQPLIL